MNCACDGVINCPNFCFINVRFFAGPIASAALHQWIDLIFGFKQCGAAAAAACNTFYYLTYPSCAAMVKEMQVSDLQDKVFEYKFMIFVSVTTLSFLAPHRSRSQVLVR
jgi:hypothetical protein